MTSLSSKLDGIGSGDVVNLDGSQTYTLSSDISISGSGWEVHGNGARVVPEGVQNISLSGDGYVFEGFWFDQPAGGIVQLYTDGEWTVRNLGWAGTADGDSGSGSRRNMRLGTASGANCTLENIYLGAFTDDGGNILNSNGRHNGHIEARWLYGRGSPDNSIYGVDSSGDRHQGTWAVRDSYFTHNTISDVRIGTEDAESIVENCSFVKHPDRPTHTDNGARNYRGVWCYYGTVVVRGCTFNTGISEGLVEYNRSGTNIVDDGNNQFNVSNPPVPEGCPTTPKEAANAEGSSGGGGGEPSLPNLLHIQGSGVVTEYAFETDGTTIEASSEQNATFNSEDSIDGTTASGAVYGGADAYRFDGSLTALSTNNTDATLTLNGSVIVASDYPDPGQDSGGGGGGGGGSTCPNESRVDQLESDVQALKEDMRSARGNISDLKGKMNSVQDTQTKLKNLHDKVKSAFSNW